MYFIYMYKPYDGLCIIPLSFTVYNVSPMSYV